MLRQCCEFSQPKLRWITMDYYMLNIIIATNILISLAAIFECVGVHISGNENVPKVVLSLVKAAAYADDWRCVDCACAKTE